MYDNDFRDLVLLDPIKQGAEPLKIVSGYISKAVHEGFNTLVSRNGISRHSTFNCQYVIDGAPVHSKLYLWEKNGIPFLAFMGSANYTQSAFSSQRRELIQECDPNKALDYFKIIEANTMYCYHAEIEESQHE